MNEIIKGKGKRGKNAEGTPNGVDKHVGERIKLRRKLLGMSQEALGEKLGLTFQQVQKYERGANRVGSSRLWDLSQILDVPVGFFFDDMSDETHTRTPRFLMGGIESEVNSVDRDLLSRQETLDLVRRCRAMPSGVRRQVFELAKALGSVETPASPPEAPATTVAIPPATAKPAVAVDKNGFVVGSWSKGR